MRLFPLPLPETRKMETLKVESCIMHYDTGLYSAAPRKRLL